MIELTFNGYSLLITVAVIIAITFGFLLLIPQVNSRASRFLAALMFIVAGWNASLLIVDLYLYRYAAGVIWVPMKYTLALGPCFYFYIRFTSDFERHEKIRVWPHFIPVIFEVLLFLFQVFQAIPQRIGYFQTTTFQVFDPLVNVLAILSLMTYGYWARLRIQKYHNWVKHNYSHFHRYNINWLYRLSTVFLIFMLLWLGYFSVDFWVYDYQLSFADYYPFHLTLAVISIWLCVESFSKPGLVLPEHQVSDGGKDKPSPMPSDELVEKAKWLNQQIADNLLYLDPELSLRSLATTLEIHPNVLSRIINEGLQQTFSDCINGYRVNAVINKLKSPATRQQTMLAIAFDCGFNSKTTFNRVFKKYIGQTPIQYRDQLKKNE